MSRRESGELSSQTVLRPEERSILRLSGAVTLRWPSERGRGWPVKREEGSKFQNIGTSMCLTSRTDWLHRDFFSVHLVAVGRSGACGDACGGDDGGGADHADGSSGRGNDSDT